ncbi:hypothetical protein [Ensifer sp.]|uniref:hypothetical protein n=1 Tax=Ensifer sp. TaxID=1872086 RepID=UPI000DD7496D|nr:hypothetical protein [Ensifer sp.]
MTSTKKDLFKPERVSAADKAAATDQTARGIVAAEKLAREKKTEKLKAQRLLQEADAEPVAPAPKRQVARKGKTA